MSDLTNYDSWLNDAGPAALVIREQLMPVEGADGVVFPPTYAASKDAGKDGFKGGYNIDPRGERGNVCTIDSVGSQANRIEPIFASEPYSELVPQIVVQAGDVQVNLLSAGHRAGDALVRCSGLRQELQDAFKAVQKGDCEPLARIAPTSLVFGVWDSRDTQAKVPRLVASTIRAFDVTRLTRSAQYVPATEYVRYEEDGTPAADSLLPEPADKQASDAYAERGFVHVPASGTHGGVIAAGGIRRDATLSLAALRMLAAGGDPGKTLALRRYILGLALTAFTNSRAVTGYLRQGCQLVLNPDADKPREFVAVHGDGRREPADVTHEAALNFADAAAKAFGVGKSRTVPFDTERAKADVAGEAKPKKPRKKAAGK